MLILSRVSLKDSSWVPQLDELLQKRNERLEKDLNIIYVDIEVYYHYPVANTTLSRFWKTAATNCNFPVPCLILIKINSTYFSPFTNGLLSFCNFKSPYWV